MVLAILVIVWKAVVFPQNPEPGPGIVGQAGKGSVLMINCAVGGAIGQGNVERVDLVMIQCEADPDLAGTDRHHEQHEDAELSKDSGSDQRYQHV